MHRDVLAGDYAAAYARPDTSGFAKLKAIAGPKRYSNLTQADRDLVKVQEILCNRIATILEELTLLKLPWICQTAATAGKQAFLGVGKGAATAQAPHRETQAGGSVLLWSPLREPTVHGVQFGRHG